MVGIEKPLLTGELYYYPIRNDISVIITTIATFGALLLEGLGGAICGVQRLRSITARLLAGTLLRRCRTEQGVALPVWASEHGRCTKPYLSGFP